MALPADKIADNGRIAESGGFSIGGHRLHAPRLEAGLYLVSTPIGHLKDITLRALETLASAHLIACEDTRVSRVLLSHYGITTPMMAYHEHNAETAGRKIIEALDSGPVALISDAGTPLVSDPGSRLVSQVLEAGHQVVPVPGASAVLAALVAADLGDSQFHFIGFLPSKEKARADLIRSAGALAATVIFYDSPKRIAASLKTAVNVLGADRPAVVGRELTKRFETFYRGTLGQLAGEFDAAPSPKGEIVLLIGRGTQQGDAFDLDGALAERLAKVSLKQAVDDVMMISGLKRRQIYQRALQLRDGE
uniref:16S rRNA (cytidine(1402)-2'-O)-methyltransferase n=1 Tax=Pararhizobium sp. IMCC3301 TaxID=3067904 RepID=UPI0027404D37|nr:16S rRNA (cytidine(1402)-2'-O)-methyltransferase [Pararhizobium sp. IMCC3301]